MKDNPVLDSGKVEVATMGVIRNYTIGRAVVLSGRLGHRVVGPNEPIDLLSLLTEGYRTYATIDTTARSTVRREKCRMADPRYSFEMVVSLAARVADPATYLQTMGSSASLFDAFYPEVAGALAMACSQFEPPELNEAQSELSALSQDIKRQRPFYKGVEIMQFDATIEYDAQLKKMIGALDTMASVNKFGEEILIYTAETEEQLAHNTRKLAEIDGIQRRRHANKHAEINAALDTTKRLVNEFGQEPGPLLEHAKVREALGRIIELPAPRADPGVLRLTSSRREDDDDR
jgi:hypothetical protein